MDYLNLVSDFKGKTIKLPIVVMPASVNIVDIPRGHQLILDTGADTSALTEEFLMLNGYSNFQKSVATKRIATGKIELLTCQISEMTIAKQFKVNNVKVDVLTGWEEHTVVGVIGMDILSRLTFILSHEHKKFLLSSKVIPELARIFS